MTNLKVPLLGAMLALGCNNTAAECEAESAGDGSSASSAESTETGSGSDLAVGCWSTEADLWFARSDLYSIARGMEHFYFDYNPDAQYNSGAGPVNCPNRWDNEVAPLRRCPEAATGKTPLNLNCTVDNQCFAVHQDYEHDEAPAGADYLMAAWEGSCGWRGVNFRKTSPHTFAYSFTCTETDAGTEDAVIEFEIRAESDYDLDGTPATVTLAGSVDAAGMTLEEPVVENACD